jgi:fluoride ion exporter CrcB/FEX
MGIALWLGGGVVAFLLARIVPLGRGSARLGELTVAVVTAMALGVVATAFDFGGWREPDWRAGLFAFLGALAMVGVLRAARIEN